MNDTSFAFQPLEREVRATIGKYERGELTSEDFFEWSARVLSIATSEWTPWIRDVADSVAIVHAELTDGVSTEHRARERIRAITSTVVANL